MNSHDEMTISEVLPIKTHIGVYIPSKYLLSVVVCDIGVVMQVTNDRGNVHASYSTTGSINLNECPVVFSKSIQ